MKREEIIPTYIWGSFDQFVHVLCGFCAPCKSLHLVSAMGFSSKMSWYWNSTHFCKVLIGYSKWSIYLAEVLLLWSNPSILYDMIQNDKKSSAVKKATYAIRFPVVPMYYGMGCLDLGNGGKLISLRTWLWSEQCSGSIGLIRNSVYWIKSFM